MPFAHELSVCLSNLKITIWGRLQWPPQSRLASTLGIRILSLVCFFSFLLGNWTNKQLIMTVRPLILDKEEF